MVNPIELLRFLISSARACKDIPLSSDAGISTWSLREFL